MKIRLSIIIPVLNEASVITEALTRLQPLRNQGTEVVVVDGGSTDGSQNLALELASRFVRTSKGRAEQMNAGAKIATGDYLLFLHIDTQLPENADLALAKVFEAGAEWGRFDVRLSGNQPLLRMVETLMNRRSRLTGIATGDQAIFVRRDAFERIGGFSEMPLMEDIALSKQLKHIARPVCLRERVITSSRRWERNGILRTILLMWRLRLLYFLGTDPARLATLYYRP
ncbi:TIGR04283 family arsenosugar biosynthesis glycosyltransferase [Methylocaldum sp.]|uniref:TIGR04283 family arsenosugar biosynthesis glycosyltransferase n=1 Tax=Methylocaldum sp. TaxID=1969727 RepID=UPI002D42B85A|nr:TIGR04283 family arsenosugar biosynthesis glycosyltransferase [Methylocaldum sp.]HYE35072.1 TIGR04283 family arsenosugar biosynthesis glycosyltransferase [Methylocaldum sp.]